MTSCSAGSSGQGRCQSRQQTLFAIPSKLRGAKPWHHSLYDQNDTETEQAHLVLLGIISCIAVDCLGSPCASPTETWLWWFFFLFFSFSLSLWCANQPLKRRRRPSLRLASGSVGFDNLALSPAVVVICRRPSIRSSSSAKKRLRILSGPHLLGDDVGAPSNRRG